MSSIRFGHSVFAPGIQCPPLQVSSICSGRPAQTSGVQYLLWASSTDSRYPVFTLGVKCPPLWASQYSLWVSSICFGHPVFVVGVQYVFRTSSVHHSRCPVGTPSIQYLLRASSVHSGCRVGALGVQYLLQLSCSHSIYSVLILSSHHSRYSTFLSVFCISPLYSTPVHDI